MADIPEMLRASGVPEPIILAIRIGAGCVVLLYLALNEFRSRSHKRAIKAAQEKADRIMARKTASYRRWQMEQLEKQPDGKTSRTLASPTPRRDSM